MSHSKLVSVARCGLGYGLLGLVLGCGSSEPGKSDAISGQTGGGASPGDALAGGGASAAGRYAAGSAGAGVGAEGGTAGGSGSAGAAGTPNGTAGTTGFACSFTDVDGRSVSNWAARQANGDLSYATLASGDRVLDFSNAGYQGGGVALPRPAVAITLQPSGADDTDAIQTALDAASRLPLNAGVRGAVLLAAGSFTVTSSLHIGASGVVLRGSGSGMNGTTLRVGGAPHTAIVIGGGGSRKSVGTAATITDAYVAVGARTFHVDSTAGFAVGNTVLVSRPVTRPWLERLGMAGLVRNGKPETWLAEGTVIDTDRVITMLAGDSVTLDAPLSDALDQKYVSPPGAKLTRYAFDGRIEEVGIEHVRLQAPRRDGGGLATPAFAAISVDAAQNGFVNDVVAEEFTSGVSLGPSSKWITVQDTSLLRTASIDNSAGYPAQFSVSGQLTLVQRCQTSGKDAFAYVTQARTPGPNVVLELTAKDGASVAPHQRWATALLVDSSTIAGEIDFMNRGVLGSGHGWTMAFGVVWNSSASGFLVQAPPGTTNWAIGSSGQILERAAPGGSTPLPNGTFDSHGMPVTPGSLYLAQLCERLGPAAIEKIQLE